MKKETYGLNVEQGIRVLPNREDRIQYYITEDDLPIYEVNRWLEINSMNSFLTGKTYAYSLLSYLRFLKKHNLHYLEVTSKAIIEEYVKFMLYDNGDSINLQGKHTVNSIKQKITVLKCFYEWLEDNSNLENNPLIMNTTKKKNKYSSKKFLYGQIWEFELEKTLNQKLRYKKNQQHTKWYEINEIDSILKKLPSFRDKVIFKISIETGMRIGEILSLKLSNHNHLEGIIEIRKSYDGRNEALVKTNERDLFISDSLNNEINDYIIGERAENDQNSSNFLFINHKGKTKGKELSSKNFLKILKKAAGNTGIDPAKIRTHSGRSTHAQILLDALHKGEVTETYIMEQMGWSNIDTLKTYTRAYNEKSRISLSKEIANKYIQISPLKEGGTSE